MYKIIDAHCHIYPDKIAEKAAQATGTFYGYPPEMDGKVSTLAKIGKEVGISHFIVQSVATTPHQVSSINRFIAENVNSSNGLMTGFGTMNPESDDIKRDMEELLTLGLKGIKLHPDIQNFKIDDYRMLKIYELCEEYKLPVLMHTGDNRYDNSNPNRLVPILETYTNMIVIGGHFGGYSVWDEALEKLTGYKNFYVDTSSSLFKISPDKAKELIYAYGIDRVLFGTDYPLWNPRGELERFMEIDIPDEDRQKIFHDNAAKLLNLN